MYMTEAVAERRQQVRKPSQPMASGHGRKNLLKDREESNKTQNNIARALREIRDRYDPSLKALELACGTDDSTNSKLFKDKGDGVTRDLQFFRVEDFVYAFEKYIDEAGLDHDPEVTPDAIILKYNTREQIEKLPPRFGYRRFLGGEGYRRYKRPDKAEQEPEPEIAVVATTYGRPAMEAEMAGNKPRIVPDAMQIDIIERKTYSVKPTSRFRDGMVVAIKVDGKYRVCSWPPSGVEGEYEILGEVVEDHLLLEQA